MLYNEEDKQKAEFAIGFALRAHSGQHRRFSGLPYIVHPVEVMTLVSEYTDDVDVIIAAVLHDVLEDTKITDAQLDQHFGDRVSSLVFDLTKLVGNGPSTFARECVRLADLGEDAKTIKCCDIISNVGGLSVATDWAKHYVEQKRKQLAFLKGADEECWLRAVRVVFDKQNEIGHLEEQE